MRFIHLTVLFVVDAVVAGPSRCNYCVGNSANCSWIQRDNQLCASDANSLGTTHCASVVGKYLHDKKGDNVTDVFFRGCFNCSSKKEACFALGGHLKGDRRTLLECEIECCTSDNCNNHFPALSENAIIVFTPDASGPGKCYKCLAKDADACFSSQVEETCSFKSGSLGTTHCGSAVGIFHDKDGNITTGFLRSCIDCADKKAACAVINAYHTEERFTLPECEIDCCTESFCNRQLIPTKPISATTDASAKYSVLVNGGNANVGYKANMNFYRGQRRGYSTILSPRKTTTRITGPGQLLKDIPWSVLSEVIMHLNNSSPLRNNWKAVAAELSLSFQTVQSLDHHVPGGMTEGVLQMMFQRKMTVQDFANMMEKIQRSDIVDILVKGGLPQNNLGQENKNGDGDLNSPCSSNNVQDGCKLSQDGTSQPTSTTHGCKQTYNRNQNEQSIREQKAKQNEQATRKQETKQNLRTTREQEAKQDKQPTRDSRDTH